MLDSSSQLMLDSASTQAKSDSSSMNKSASAGNSNFSNYMDDANKSVKPKEPEKQNSQAANDSSSANTTRGFSRANKKPKQENNEKKNSDNVSAKITKSPAVKETRKAESAKTSDDSSNNTETEGVADIKQAVTNKLSVFNPMLLLQNKPDDESVEAMVAKVLQSQSDLALNAEAAAKLGTVEALSVSGNLPQENVADIVKVIAPEVGDKNIQDVLQKQTSFTQKKDVLNKASGDTAQLLGIDEITLLDDKKVDEFVSRIFDQLNLTKTNMESLISNKASDEKLQLNNMLVDQLTEKVSGEIVDKANVLASSVSSVNQRSNTLTPTQQLPLNTHINQPEWGSEFGKRIQFMINNNVQTAELRLDPPELGKINVKINISNDQTNISFTSAHQNVRDAIENTLPKLRELLADSGLQLGNADVASQFQQKTRDQDRENSNLSGPVSPQLDDIGDEISLPRVQYSVDGVIDYFA